MKEYDIYFNEEKTPIGLLPEKIVSGDNTYHLIKLGYSQRCLDAGIIGQKPIYFLGDTNDMLGARHIRIPKIMSCIELMVTRMREGGDTTIARTDNIVCFTDDLFSNSEELVASLLARNFGEQIVNDGYINLLCDVYGTSGLIESNVISAKINSVKDTIRECAVSKAFSHGSDIAIQYAVIDALVDHGDTVTPTTTYEKANKIPSLASLEKVFVTCITLKNGTNLELMMSPLPPKKYHTEIKLGDVVFEMVASTEAITEILNKYFDQVK